MAETHTIRTTMRPDVEITVSHAEYEQLLEMDVIYDGTPPDLVADPFDARVAERLADAGSATRAAVDAIVGDVTDAEVAEILDLPESATMERLRAALGAPLRPISFGAVGGGETDDTAAWLATVAALPAGWGNRVIDGGGLTYAVSAVRFPSFCTVRNAYFKALTPGTDYTAPVMVGENNDTALRTHITFENVHVDGTRAEQDNIGVGAEDGGRHGFRFVGRTEHITLIDCSATMCAIDGLEILGGVGLGDFQAFDRGIHRHHRYIRCSFTFNGRHGMSIDSADDVRFIECKFNDNGDDVPGTTDGALGDLLGGNKYGSGFDVEEYGLKTYVGDIHFIDCEAVRNQRGALVYIGADIHADDPNFVPRRGIHFIGGRYDNGIGPIATPAAIEVTCAGPNVNRGTYFEDVLVKDVDLEGIVTLRAVGTASHTGGSVTTDITDLGNADHVTDLTVSGVTPVTKSYSVDTSTVTYLDRVNELWIPAQDFGSVESTPTWGDFNNVPAWLLSDSDYDQISTTVRFPPDWRSASLSVEWVSTAAGPGDVMWDHLQTTLTEGVAVAAPIQQAALTVAAGAQGVLTRTVLRPTWTIPGTRCVVNVRRIGAEPGDTLVGDVAFLGVRISRLS